MKKTITDEARQALKATKVKFIPTQYPGVFYIESAAHSSGVKPIKVFYVRYRDVNKKPRWEKAECPEHPVVKTATQANAIRSARMSGRELPNLVRREAEAAAEKAEASKWTFDRLWESWKENNAHKSGLGRDDSRYKKNLIETFGHREPRDLKPLDIDRLKKNLIEGGYAPDTVVSVISLLRRIANYGLDRQLCAGLTFRIKLDDKKLKRRNRTEQLTSEETERYRKVCREYKNAQIGNLCLLVEQSGIRKGNAWNLKWSDIDFENGFMRLAETKSGEVQILPISDVALEILRNHPRVEGSEFVFSGRDTHFKGRLSEREIREGVKEIRDAADLPMIEGKMFRPLHGLRHALGSRLANDGAPLYHIQHILGHASPVMTARYSHLTNKALRDTLNAISKGITETA